MSPKIIELKQAPVVLVEFSEVVDNLQIFNDIGRPYLSYYTKPINTHRAYLPDGDYVVLGYLSDLTEEQFAEILGVDFCEYCSLDKRGVYGTDGGYAAGCEGSRCDDTRDVIAERFYSLLESENVYTENPYKHPDVIYNNRDDSNIFQKCSMKKWQESQSRTIDPKRTVVLLRKEDNNRH